MSPDAEMCIRGPGLFGVEGSGNLIGGLSALGITHDGGQQ